MRLCSTSNKTDRYALIDKWLIFNSTNQIYNKRIELIAQFSWVLLYFYLVDFWILPLTIHSAAFSLYARAFSASRRDFHRKSIIIY